MQALGYVFLCYVGFYFFRLAENHNKNKWVFSLVGLATFFIGYFMYVLYFRVFILEEFSEFSLVEIGYKAFLTGIFITFLLFRLLSFVWDRKKLQNNNEVDKIGKQ